MLDRLRSAGRRRLRMGLAGLGMVAVVGAVVGVAISVPRQWNASSLRSVAQPTPNSSPIAQVDETGAIPWVDTPAPPYTPVSPIYTPPPKTDARACTARDVSVSQGHGNGETGALEIGFVFTNTSPTTCVLLGYPEAVAREPRHPDVLAKHATSPGVTPANMPPGTTTDLFLYTYRDCPARYANPSGGFPSDLFHEVTFTLPGGGTVTRGSS